MFKRKPKADPGLPPANIVPFRKRKSIVALDIDGDTLRIAHGSGQGPGARITRFDSVPLELPAEKRDQPEAMGAALKKALETARVKPKEAVIALPRGQVVLRPLQVPMVSDMRELASIINFQISKDLPFRIEDAAVDFKILRALELTPPEGGEVQKRLDVLVGAVKADVVEYYRTAAKLAGFRLAGLGLRSIATAYYAMRSVNTDAPFLLVSVRSDEVTLEIVSQGKLVFSRAAIVDRENLLKSLQIEVVRSLHSFEGSGGYEPIQQLVVAGGSGLEGEIASTLGESLKVPALVLDPTARLDVRNLDKAEAAHAVAPFGLALSALEPTGLMIDFANPKKPAVQRNTRRTQGLILAVAAVAVLFTVLGVRANLVKKRLAIKQQVQAQLTDAEKKQPIYRKLKTQAKSVNGWVAEEQNWLDHLAYLSAVLPAAEEIYVSAFTTTPQHVVRFSVQSKTGELLAELDKKLRAAGYELKPLSITPANDKYGYSFRTTVELTIPKKLKPDITKIKPAPRPADDSPPKAATLNKREVAS